MSHITESTLLFYLMSLLDGQDLRPGPRTVQDTFSDSTGFSIPPVTIDDDLGLTPLDYGNDASGSHDIPATIEVLPGCIELGPQSNFHPCEASSIEFSDPRNILTFPRPNPAELERAELLKRPGGAANVIARASG